MALWQKLLSETALKQETTSITTRTLQRRRQRNFSSLADSRR